MRVVKGSVSKIVPIVEDDIKHLSKRLAAIVAPVLEQYLYFVTEGIHGALKDENGNPVIELNRAPNENGDLFFWDELIGESLIPGQKVYATWIDKPVLENHDEKCVRGVIIDTHPDENRRSVDMLDAVDKTKHPKLAQDILDGKVTDTSMGVIVSYSLCSVCGAKFNDTNEWCSHLRMYKGKKHPETGELVYEISHGLIGLEDSIITVGRGADKDAKIREILAADEKTFKAARAFKTVCKELGIPEDEVAGFLSYLLSK